MSDKNIDWLKRLQLLEKALEKNGIKAGVWVELETKINGYELDFSKHDKVFEDKIAKLEKENKALNLYLVQREQDSTDMIMELKQRIAELESKENIIEVRVPASPIEIATHLINNTCTINELKMIAEHINVYCNGGK